MPKTFLKLTERLKEAFRASLRCGA